MFDIAIVGGGLAGSTAAAVFGRKYRVALIDQHDSYPPVFAADKIAGDQIGLLRAINLFEPLAKTATPATRVLNARYGHVIERKVIDEYGIRYQTMVETMRAQIAPAVERIVGTVVDVTLGENEQRVVLSSGREIKARLVVLASGFSDVLRAKLGIKRCLIKANHSLTFGFDVGPVAAGDFRFPTITYYGDRVADGVDYINMFPIGETMRVNLFVYREPDEAWSRDFRGDPQASVYGVLPGLRRFMPSFEVTGPIQMRTVDLYTVDNHVQPGLVLIGDASQTPCPALGMGLSHLLTDVVRLDAAYVHDWLATPGMSAEKIAQFYADPAKRHVDALALHGANYRRAVSTQTGWKWELHRRQVYWRRRLRGFIQRANPFDAANLTSAALGS